MFHSILFDLFAYFAPPPAQADTDSLTTAQQFVSLVAAAIMGYLIKLWFTKPLEKGEQYEDAEHRQMLADIKELKAFKDQAGSKIAMLELETKNGFSRLEEKVSDLSSKTQAIELAVRSIDLGLAKLTALFENQTPRKSNRTG